MAKTVKCYILIYTRLCNPQLYSVVRTGWRVYISKNIIIGGSSFTHQLYSLCRYVEVFLPCGFLLLENDTGKIALLINITR